MERGASHKAALKQTEPTLAHAGVGAAEMIHDLYAARRRNAKRRTSVHPHCEHGQCRSQAGCSGRKTNIVRVVVNVVKTRRERETGRERE